MFLAELNVRSGETITPEQQLQQELFSRAGNDIQAIIDNIFAAEDASDLGEHYKPVASRRIKRMADDDLIHMTGVVMGLTIGVLPPNPDRDVRSSIRSLVDTDFSGLHPRFRNAAKEAFIEKTALSVEDGVYSAVCAASNEIVSVAKDVIGDDKEKQLVLIKLWTSPRKVDKENESAIHPLYALDTALAFEHIDNRGSEDSLYSSLAQGLRDDHYDELIAKSLLTDAVNTASTDPSMGKVQKDLQNLIRLVAITTNTDYETAISMLSRRSTIRLWGDDNTKTFDNAKNSLIQGLEDRLAIATVLLERCALVVGNGSEEEYHKQLRALVAFIGQKFSRSKLGHSNANVVAARVEQRASSKRPRHAASTAGAVIIPAVVEALPEVAQRKLITMNALCETRDDEASLEEVKHDYIKAHMGKPNLQEDISRVLDYLSKVDLSKGLVRGLKKYTKSMRPGNGSLPISVYSFKPSDAPGLSLRSRSAKKVRILFTSCEEGRYAILGIAERSDIPRLERNLGIGTSAA